MRDLSADERKLLEMGGELAQFKQFSLYAYLQKLSQAAYTQAVTQLTHAALDSTDLRLRGLALDVMKKLNVWDELESIQKQVDQLSVEITPPPEGEKSEFEYDTP